MDDTLMLSIARPVVRDDKVTVLPGWRRFERNEALYQARCQQHWSLTAISSRIGVSLNAYSDWERGRTLPLRHWLQALCTLFQLPPSALGFPIHILPYARSQEDEAAFICCRHERLFEHRFATGKIACDIAEEVGVETAQYVSWELGIEIPSPLQLEVLCALFLCSPQSLGFSLAADKVLPERMPEASGASVLLTNVLLSEVRRQRGWSKMEVAKRVGVSVAAYRYWERGRRIPSLQHLHRLCEVFQLPQDQLGYASFHPKASVCDMEAPRKEG